MIVKTALQGEAQKHQLEAAEKSQHTTGLLLYHGLGSGKTRSALEIGERTKGIKLVVPPAALRENFIKEIKKHGANPDEYKIVSLETFRKDPDKYISEYKPSAVIADEFHRTRNTDSVSYEAFKHTRGKYPKMIGLTGSPISNHPSELVPLINTIAGRKVFQNEDAFNQNFIHEKKVDPGFFNKLRGIRPGTVAEPKNLGLLQAAVAPYVHSFNGDEKYKKHIPDVKIETEYVPMSHTQQQYYDFTFGQLPRWARRKIEGNLPPSKRESRSMNTFLSAARQVSDSTDAFGFKDESSKIRKMTNDIVHGVETDPNFKSVTYSNFLDSGLKPLARQLNNVGLQYGMFTGEQNEKERQQILKDYNSGKLRHLLVSPAGSEGLDLVGTKLLQLTESQWNPERTKQVIGRTARYRSHDALPQNERHVLVKEYMSEPKMRLSTKVKRFFGVLPKDVHEIGVDQYIHERADEKAKLNQAFLDALSGVK